MTIGPLITAGLARVCNRSLRTALTSGDWLRAIVAPVTKTPYTTDSNVFELISHIIQIWFYLSFTSVTYPASELQTASCTPIGLGSALPQPIRHSSQWNSPNTRRLEALNKVQNLAVQSVTGLQHVPSGATIQKIRLISLFHWRFSVFKITHGLLESPNHSVSPWPVKSCMVTTFSPIN